VVQAGRAGQLVTADNKGLVWYTWEGRDSRKQVLQKISVVQARAGRLKKFSCCKVLVWCRWRIGAAENSCSTGLVWRMWDGRGSR
jgi:hypothetical protein